MAPEWDIGMGMDFGMGMGLGTGASASAATAPLTGSASPAYLYGLPSTDTLRIDDLLDFSNHDVFPSAEAHLLPTPEQSSAITAAIRPFSGVADSSIFQSHHHTSSFPDDIYIPSEEAAELEWLSKFVEDSFSDIPYPTTVTGVVAPAGDAHLRAESSVPGRGARSKRSRGPTGFSASAAWSSLPPPSQTSPSSSSSSSSSDFPPSKPKASAGSSINNNNNGRGKKGGGDIGLEGGVRRCTHCASEKTPQWRTGPLGPKTLCNACGVRYKSGRLVPEYRPAASPTFVLTQHSNSHRKVMELRRQKELLLLRHDNPSAAATSATAAPAPRPELLFQDYGVC